MDKKVLLLILDGWGASEKTEGNAILAAKTPCYDKLLENYPNTKLNASNTHVGLPDGVMGNSEVGHENIGSGRMIKQKLTMISDLIQTGEFFENPVLKEAFEHVLKNKKEGKKSRIHFMGLISEGDVHAHLGHLDGLLEMAAKLGLENEDIYLHAISDGRDDPPYVAEKLMKRYEEKVQVATVAGRYWAMDRDNNWDRVEKYTRCVFKETNPLLAGDTKATDKKSKAYMPKSALASSAITNGYAIAKEGINKVGDSDEFILPTLINENGLIENGDSVVFFNFRPDRAREISTIFEYFSASEERKTEISSDPAFAGNELITASDDYAKLDLSDLHYVCFTEYSDVLNLPIAFSKDSLPEQDISLNLGEIISNAGFHQLRTAETEKFNHVTSFFNTGRKQPYPNEDRVLIPSPKVATYDLKPEMSVHEVTDVLLDSMSNKDKNYKLIVCNFANPDMVGHTGIWDAVISALETVDEMLEKIINKAKEEGYTVMITADHGNADQMYEDDGSIRTAHSLNIVPFLVVNSAEDIELKDFNKHPELALSNIAPTILETLEIEKPSQMSASSLIA